MTRPALTGISPGAIRVSDSASGRCQPFSKYQGYKGEQNPRGTLSHGAPNFLCLSSRSLQCFQAAKIDVRKTCRRRARGKRSFQWNRERAGRARSALGSHGMEHAQDPHRRSTFSAQAGPHSLCSGPGQELTSQRAQEASAPRGRASFGIPEWAGFQEPAGRGARQGVGGWGSWRRQRCIQCVSGRAVGR